MLELHRCAALTLLLLAPSPALAEGDVDDLPARLDRLVARLESEREKAHVPGLALAVVVGDEVVLARGFGLADVGRKTPVTPETLFAIGSTTKAFTAAVIGMLVDDRKLDWDTPVEEILPYFTPPIDASDGDARLTIRDLLSHRSGFTRMGVLWGIGAAGSEEILRSAARAEPLAGFRERFLYNNVMYLAAGTAAGVAAKTSWEQLVAERIFAPLGMKSSSTSVRAAKKDPRLALGYQWDADAEWYEHKTMLELDRIGPAGSINSNAIDMAQWVRFQVGDGVFAGERLLSEECVRETRSPQIDVADGVKYGLGWMLRDWRGEPLVEHGGNIDGFAAQVALLPESHLGFVLLANVSATSLQQGSIELVFDALTGELPDAAAAVEASAGRFDAFVGSYRANFASFQDEVFDVLVQDGRLAVDVPRQRVYELKEPDDEGKRYFALTDRIAVSFERDADGRVVGMMLYQAGYTFELPREGVELAPEVPLDELEIYLGKYHDERLGEDLEVVIQNNRLAVDVPGQMVFELYPPDEEGRWVLRISDELAVRFDPGDDGNVASMTFFERGTERECPRVPGTEDAARELPTVAEVLALRGERWTSSPETRGAVHARGTVRMAQAGLEGHVDTWIAWNGSYRNDMDFGDFGKMRESTDGERAWSWDALRGVDELSGDRKRQFLLSHPAAQFGDWRAFHDRVRVVRREVVGGRERIVVELKSGGLPTTTLFVDAESGDVVRIEAVAIHELMQLPTVTRLEDFRDVDGMRVPFRLISKNEATGRTILQYEEWKVGVELEEGFFRLSE